MHRFQLVFSSGLSWYIRALIVMRAFCHEGRRNAGFEGPCTLECTTGLSYLFNLSPRKAKRGEQYLALMVERSLLLYEGTEFCILRLRIFCAIDTYMR